MNTIETLKQNAIDAMAAIDLSRLSVEELGLYMNALSTLNTACKPDYMEQALAHLTVNGFGLGRSDEVDHSIYGLTSDKPAVKEE